MSTRLSQAVDNLCGETGLWLRGLDGRPRSNAAPVVDTAGSMLFALGIVSSLLERERTGVARRVETDLFSVCMALMAHRLVWMDGTPAPDLSPTVERADGYSAVYTYYETADGWISVGAVSETLCRRLFAALGLDALHADPRYASWDGILRHQAELRAQLAPLFRARSTDHWCDALERHSIPVGRLHQGAEIWRHPQLAALGRIERVRHPQVGRYRAFGSPIRRAGARATTRSAAPMLGQHTAPILRSLAFDRVQIRRLLDDDVVRTAPAP